MVSDKKNSREQIRQFLSDNVNLILPDVIVKGDTKPSFESPHPVLVQTGESFSNLARISSVTPRELNTAAGYSIRGAMPEYSGMLVESVTKEIQDNIDKFENEEYAEAVVNAALERIKHLSCNYINALADLNSAISAVKSLDSAIGQVAQIIEERRAARMKKENFRKYIKLARDSTRELDESVLFNYTNPSPSMVVIPYLEKTDFVQGNVRYKKGFEIVTECYKTDRVKHKSKSTYIIIAILRFNDNLIVPNNTFISSKSFDTVSLKSSLKDDKCNVLCPSFCTIKVTKICQNFNDSVVENFERSIDDMVSYIFSLSDARPCFVVNENGNNSRTSHPSYSSTSSVT